MDLTKRQPRQPENVFPSCGTSVRPFSALYTLHCVGRVREKDPGVQEGIQLSLTKGLEEWCVVCGAWCVVLGGENRE